MREGGALLQGLASCGPSSGDDGRRLHTHYRDHQAKPGYHCSGKVLVEGRGVYCLTIGGTQIDEAVARAFLAAAEQLEAHRDEMVKRWRLGVERAVYQAQRA